MRAAQPSATASRRGRIRLFTWGLYVAWGAALLCTIAAEDLPAPLVSPFLFYTLLVGKASLFVVLGFLTPLTFWRFDSLGLGVVFAAGMALAGEFMQAFSPGHSASVTEFGGKLFLLLLGFAVGLGSRYDRRVGIGSLSLDLLDSHRKGE